MAGAFQSSDSNASERGCSTFQCEDQPSPRILPRRASQSRHRMCAYTQNVLLEIERPENAQQHHSFPQTLSLFKQNHFLCIDPTRRVFFRDDLTHCTLFRPTSRLKSWNSARTFKRRSIWVESDRVNLRTIFWYFSLLLFNSQRLA